MKNVIYTFYNINVDNLNKEKNNYFFYYNNELYLFSLVENNIEIIDIVYNFFKNNNLDCYEIIFTKDNSLFSVVDRKRYALLKIKGILKYEVKFEDMKYYPIDKKANNWGKLWGERLDYYEIQLNELGFNYQTVLNSYGFFSGIAENAIIYYNLCLKKFNTEEIVVGVVHNRMHYPCYLVDYNNPLNFVIDYNIRDISEYIKSYLMNDEYNLDNVLILLDKLKINNLMFNLLYSRLLYPTFYFDIFDKIILEDGVDNDIVLVLGKVDDYLEMLRNIYLKFKDKYNMLSIEWLNFNYNKNVEN